MKRYSLLEYPAWVFINELTHGRPVQVWVDRYHCVMVYGYSRDKSGNEQVLVMDPQPGKTAGWDAFGSRPNWSALWTGLSYEGKLTHGQ